jgi:MFS superfamily sulfate permease-like transporter
MRLLPACSEGFRWLSIVLGVILGVALLIFWQQKDKIDSLESFLT